MLKSTLNRLSLALSLALLCSAARAQNNPAPPEGMVLVPAGEFTMGTDQGEAVGPNVPRSYNDARPRHKMTLPAFFIDTTEVTNAQYKEYCDVTNYPAPPHWKSGSFPVGEGDFPITHITIYEAAAYAAWAGKRLPTEFEWEKAARGTDARDFPWGSNWDGSRLVTNRNRGDRVGKFPNGASPYGALDMAGNVFEWTSSWYDAYPNAPVKFAEYGEVMKVIRGGGFDGYDHVFRSYFRSVAYPGSRSVWIGFRCVKDVK